MGAVNHPEDYGSKLRDLERQLREIRDRVGNISAFIGQGGLTIGDNGALSMKDASGVERFFVGLRADIPLPDGSPQPVLIVRDSTGIVRFAIYDPDAASGYQPVVWIIDHLGQVVFTTDMNGGAAEPWIPVPLYRQFHDSAFPDAAGTTETLPVSACNGGVVWEGRIGKVSHPRIQYDANLGRVTGVSGNPTYTFHVGGTQLDSFNVTGFGANLRGPFDISDKLGDTNVVVQLKCSATGTGTDRIAMGMLGCWMRQT